MNLNRANGFIVLLFSILFSTVSFAAVNDKAVFTPKIINGVSDENDEFGFVVYLQGLDNETFAQGACSGSFIHPQYILTAAHCIQISDSIAFSPDELTVMYNIDGLLPIGDGVIKKASEIYIHPDYDTTTLYNDIAIIKLESPAEDNTLTGDVAVAPVLLPSHELIERIDYGTPVNIAGWGATNADATEFPNDVQVGTLSLIGPEVCEFSYPAVFTSGGIGFNSELSLCANEFDSNEDADTETTDTTTSISSICSGDSGGPMFTTDGDGNAYILGINSAGPASCGSENVPDIFTSVCVYLPFISAALGDDYVYDGELCPNYPTNQTVIPFNESDLNRSSSSSSDSIDTANGSFSTFMILALSLLMLLKRLRRS